MNRFFIYFPTPRSGEGWPAKPGRGGVVKLSDKRKMNK